MFLKELKIANFRNCKEVEILFSPNINCFIGKNGAGKTNLLDAVYYLRTTKTSFPYSAPTNATNTQRLVNAS